MLLLLLLLFLLLLLLYYCLLPAAVELLFDKGQMTMVTMMMVATMTTAISRVGFLLFPLSLRLYRAC